MEPIKLYRHKRYEWRLPADRAYGDLHREDGPAIEYFDNIGKIYYRYNVITRFDGPAIFLKYSIEISSLFWQHSFGDTIDYRVKNGILYAWVINGHMCTSYIEEWAMERGIDLNNMSEEDKFFLHFEWAKFGKTEH